MSEHIRILLADDDELIILALRTILSKEKGMEICGDCADGGEAVRLYQEHLPDVVLSDIRMPYGTEEPAASDIPGGLLAAERILREHPDARILLLTTFPDDEYIIRALRLGVSGYLLKQDYAALPAAIRAAYEGQNVFGAEITAKMPALLAKPQADATPDGKDTAFSPLLNGRESEISALIAEGLSNKEIAERMFLSEGTVRNYLSVILEKLNLRDRTQLAIFVLTGKRTGE